VKGAGLVQVGAGWYMAGVREYGVLEGRLRRLGGLVKNVRPFTPYLFRTYSVAMRTITSIVLMSGGG
jgi:hypothetical protein